MFTLDFTSIIKYVIVCFVTDTKHVERQNDRKEKRCQQKQTRNP